MSAQVPASSQRPFNVLRICRLLGRPRSGLPR